MSLSFDLPFWKNAPIIRLLLPLVAGIILQWYIGFSFFFILTCILCFGLAFLLFGLLPVAFKFKFGFLQGMLLHLVWISAGLLITWHKDIRHQQDWYGNIYQPGNTLVVKLSEPLQEKARTFKVEAEVLSVVDNNVSKLTEGKILLYLTKDSSLNDLEYGDRLLIKKDLQPIKNSGNPGAFNYQRYAAFHQIYHQAFVKQKDWVLIPAVAGTKKGIAFYRFIFGTRQRLLDILRANLQAGRLEVGIAGALLVGFKNDLDKDLVQAYSNTGVVHLIAISGLHVGLIYALLSWVLSLIPFLKNNDKVKLIIIIAGLWLFALLTGASPSVLRASVMFTFIVMGSAFDRQASIYNSLAVSAFLLLCINPYYLWDVGFQLSYLAVLGIVMYQKPVYHIFYFKQKAIRLIWKLVSVSLAAQVLTFPLCIYYFHQFPNLFLVSNVIAVPLVTIILYAEILLVALSWITPVAFLIGKLTGGLLWILNSIILGINSLSFSVWDQIPSTILSTWVLYGLVFTCSAWLINKKKKLLFSTLLFSIGFLSLALFTNWRAANNRLMIVYNVPQHQAIDFINGNTYKFCGDSILLEDGMLQNFHLKPGRVSLQLKSRQDSIPALYQNDHFYQFADKRILVIDPKIILPSQTGKMKIDVIVISKNPNISIAGLSNVFQFSQIVFDASNPAWKIKKWAKECFSLHINFHNVSEKGAYIYNIGS